ncbi:MAG: F0F1 ATP synthase subunit delta [Candidatus Omnitrophota bacterium]
MSGMLIVQFLVLTTVICSVLIFFLKKILFDSTQGAVNRLNHETEEVRSKQKELAEKIKQANEELEKRKKEADDLVARMKGQAEEEAKAEKEKLMLKARQEAEELLMKAQRTKEEMRKAIAKDMEMKTVDFSAEILSRVLPKKADESFHKYLVEDFLNGLENIDMKVVTQEIDSTEIITARSLSDEYKERLGAILKKKLNRPVAIKTTEDPGIISGAILKIGTLSLDGSLRNMIQEEGLAIKEKTERS